MSGEYWSLKITGKDGHEYWLKQIDACGPLWQPQRDHRKKLPSRNEAVQSLARVIHLEPSARIVHVRPKKKPEAAETFWCVADCFKEHWYDGNYMHEERARRTRFSDEKQALLIREYVEDRWKVPGAQIVKVTCRVKRR